MATKQELQKEIQELRTNVYKHVETSNREMGEIQTDVAWLKKTYWVVASASISAAVGSFISIVIR